MSNIRLREFDLSDRGGFRAVDAITPEAMDAINRYTTDRIAPEDIIVRQMLLCHDQYDRAGERFPKAYLDQFAVTLPGKPVLPGHDYKALPLGKFHAAAVTGVTEDFPVLNGSPRPRKDPEMVPNTTPQRRKVNYLDAAFYYPDDEQSKGMDNRIKTGVYKSVSVGYLYDDIDCDVCRKSYFSDCPHYAMQEYEPGKFATMTYSGDATKAEAIEGSIVYLGCQPNARITKALAAGELLDVQALSMTPYGVDLLALKSVEAFARIYGHVQKSWAFPSLKVPPPSGGGVTPNAGKEQIMLERIRKLLGLGDTATEDEAFAAVEKTVKDAKAANDHWSKAEDAEAKAAKLQPLADVGKAALEMLKKQILDDDFATTGKEANPELAGLTDLYVSGQDFEKLKTLADQKASQKAEKLGKGLKGDPDSKKEFPDDPDAAKTMTGEEIRLRLGR